MSYSLSVYLVDPAHVRAAIGSGDEELRRVIGGRFRQHLERADRFLPVGEANCPRLHEALRAVIDGGPYDDRYAFQYGYAYELICMHHGRALPANPFSPFRGDWLEQVDAGLRTLGVTAVSVSDFLLGSVPPALPQPDLLPGYGEWSASDCAAGLSAWKAATDEQKARIDPEVLLAIRSCVDWLGQVAETEGAGIVGFGY